MDVFEEVNRFVWKTLRDFDKGAHSYDHTLRVFSLCMDLGRLENANLRILGTAALLHDIGRAKEKELGVSHSILSGQMSRRFLEDRGFLPDEIGSIVDAIRTHRFSEGLRPNSLEGEILSDADKLDAIGAMGVARSIAQSALTGSGIEGFLKHAEEKLLKLKDLMHTSIAQEMSLHKHDILERFVEEIRSEVDIEYGVTNLSLEEAQDRTLE